MDINGLLGIAGQIIDDPTIAANATIQFQQVITPAAMERDNAGRYVPTEATTRTVTLSCYLKQIQFRGNEMQLGIDLDAKAFRGRLVDPKFYDFPLQANSPILVTINGRTGTMVLDSKSLASATDQQYDIKSNLGQRISFYVQFKQGE